jgi:alkylation response protein AidB-like acyl-CoA dehydrogenase
VRRIPLPGLAALARGYTHRHMASNPTYEQSKEVAEASRETEWEQPSFGKELFLGNLRLDLIHPQPEVDPEAVRKGEAFLADLRTFLEEHVDAMQIERDARIPDDVIDGLKGLGALGMKIPAEYGGLGLSQVYYNRALQLAGTWHSALATLLSAHQSIGLPEPLRMFGSEEQKREWLPKVARTHVSAFLLTEPDVGSDPARMSATATPTEDGTGYRIDGLKLWATNGAIADVVVIMAVVPRTDAGAPGDGDRASRGGITAFICPYDAAGITVEARNGFMGLRGIENSLTRFEDVFVPSEAVIGGVGQGLKIALATLNTGRLSLPAICASQTKYALKIAREWSNERKQWGKPIGKHDPIAQKLAFLAGTTFGLDAVVDVSSRLADDKRNDIRIEAALAKLYASELSWQAVDTMVQIRGGRAYETAESLATRGEKPVPAEQLLRDNRINRIFEGSTEIMHLLIAREAVDQHLKVAGDILLGYGGLGEKAKLAAKAGAFYAKWLPQLAVGEGMRPGAFGDDFGPLAEHLRYVERASRKLARSTFYSMGRYQAKLEQKGAHLGRIVDIGAELYAIACACVYAHTLGREDAARREQAYELAGLFAKQARRRADAKFAELFDNEDAEQYGSAQQLLDGRYTWLEEGIADPAGEGPMIPSHEESAERKFEREPGLEAPKVKA